MQKSLLVSAASLFALACSVPLPPSEGDRQDDAREVSGQTVRVVSWNIETIGDPGSFEYDAALQILARLDADIVTLQEVQWDVDDDALAPFAADAGYDYVVSGWPVSFGYDTQVILSRHPVTWSGVLDADVLSTDSGANDVTRAYPVAEIDIDGTNLTVASAHFKAGGTNLDEFRRSVDAQRAVEALRPFDPNTDRVLFSGDLNDDLGDGANWPATWTYAPGGLPSSYRLGSDIEDMMNSSGMPNDIFSPFTDAGLHVLDAYQLAGGDVTRPASGRRLDYFIVSGPLVEHAETEIYDTNDEHLFGLPKTGPVPWIDTLDAADHLPVFVDLWFEGEPAEPTEPTEPIEPTEPGDVLTVDQLGAGDLLITEAMPNPDGCSDTVGEWVEVLNATAASVDLSGLQLCDAHSCGEVVDVGILSAGDVAVFARSQEACGVTVDGVFEAALSNGGDSISLEGAVTIDSVSYTGTDPDVSWVFGASESCEGELGGTPGEALNCDGSPVVEPPEEPTEPTEPSDVVWTIDDVPSDVLQITEVMPNPSECGDEVGEWVEVTNTSSDTVELAGIRLADNNSDAEVDTAVVLGPGARALFARSFGACELPYVDGTFAAALSNGGDSVQLLRADGEVLTSMSYSVAPSGESWSSVDDDWCISETATPGDANVCSE